jgi:hypothetical protein
MEQKKQGRESSLRPFEDGRELLKNVREHMCEVTLPYY